MPVAELRSLVISSKTGHPEGCFLYFAGVLLAPLSQDR